MKQWAAAAVFITCACLLASAQGMAPSPATTLTGEVVSEFDGRPLNGVHVSLATDGPTQPATSTDSFGRFSLSVPTAARYQLVARKAGYVRGRLTVINANDPPQRIPLQPGSVITGHVVDDAGEPVLQAIVRGVTPDGTSVQQTLTDDEGAYRLFVTPNQSLWLTVTTSGIESGRIATGGQIRIERPDHTLFYPGTEAVDAAVSQVLRPGEVREGMDFVVSTDTSARQPYRGFETTSGGLGITLGTTVEGTGVVQGRATDDSGRALANALVWLAPERAGGGIRMTRADASGVFEFRGVAAGSIRLMGSKVGHAPDGASLVIAANQERPARVDLRLTPWASITGQIVDEFGEPVQDARVQILRSRYAAGRRTLMTTDAASPTTDDQGRFRIYGLDPGTYLLEAEWGVGTSAGSGYPPAYYPGTAIPSSAVPVTIRPGSTLVGIDIALSRFPTHRVSGQLRGAIITTSARTQVQLWPKVSGPAALSAPIAGTLTPDGRFEFLKVPSGVYTLQAYYGRFDSSREGWFGAADVAVSGSDISDLEVITTTGSTVTGRVVFEPQVPGQEPNRAGIEISPVPADVDRAPATNWATAGVGPDWRFALSGISGPRRLIPTRLPPGWRLAEIRARGVDLTELVMSFGAEEQSLTDVEIVVTNRPVTLDGRVSGINAAVPGAVQVIAYSSDRARWYLQSRHVRRVSVDPDGRFSLTAMPSGTYYLVATTILDDSWQDPAVLEAFVSRATFVTIDDAPRTPVELRVQQP